MAEEKKEQPKKEVAKKATPKKVVKPAAPKVELDTRPFTPNSR